MTGKKLTNQATKPRTKPTRYSPQAANRLCAEVAKGKSLRKVCEDEDQPSVTMVYMWFKKYPDLIVQYARAKDDSADSDQDRLDEIAEQVLAGTLCERKARVAADIIKWSASKKKPKKYGDRIYQDVHNSDYDSLSDQEVERELAAAKQDNDSVRAEMDEVPSFTTH